MSCFSACCSPAEMSVLILSFSYPMACCSFAVLCSFLFVVVYEHCCGLLLVTMTVAHRLSVPERISETIVKHSVMWYDSVYRTSLLPIE